MFVTNERPAYSKVLIVEVSGTDNALLFHWSMDGNAIGICQAVVICFRIDYVYVKTSQVFGYGK